MPRRTTVRGSGPIRRTVVVPLLALCVCADPPALGAQEVSTPPVPELGGSAGAADLLAGLPLSFVENRGQWDTPARFVARRDPMIVYLEPEAVALELRELDASGGVRTHVLRMAFEGATESVALEGEERLPGVRNYLLGDDPRRWRAGVASYAAVLYRGLYPGVDVRVREQEGRVEYDLLLAAGVDPARVIVRCEGIECVEIEADGSLRMDTELGPVRQSPPRTWEVLADGARREIDCRFVLVGERGFGFALPERDPSRAVVIDPGLEWSTYYGGDDHDTSLAMDYVAAAGHLVIGGRTLSMALPGASGSLNGLEDAFVARLDPNATGAAQLVWATYLGGSNRDRVYALEVDDQGDVLLAGTTASIDFPTTAGAYDEVYNGGSLDGFVAELSADGSTVLYGTYLGGNSFDYGISIARIGPSAVSVVGTTNSADFPTTAGALQPMRAGLRDDFVAQLTLGGSGPLDLNYSTYLGGSGNEGGAIDHSFPGNMRQVVHDVDGTGRIVVAGRTVSTDFPVTPDAHIPFNSGGADIYVARVDPAGAGPSDLDYATYVGGTDAEGALSVIIQSTGTVVLGGYTYSGDFPITPGAFQQVFHGPVGFNDCCLLWLDPSQSGSNQLLYSTYVGGEGFQAILGLVPDGSGGVIGTGFTGPAPVGDTSFPTTPGAWDRTFAGVRDGFVLRLMPAGTGAGDLLYSTLFGGSQREILEGVALVPASDPPRVLCAGMSEGPTPTTPGALQGTFGGVADAIALQLELSPVFTSFCPGDGSGSACPCGNESAPGAGQGCANSGGTGGRLDPDGSASASTDDLGFQATGLLPFQPALLFVGLDALNGGDGIWFGDGLRCAGNSVIRLGTMTPDGSGAAGWGPGLGALGGWSAGDTRYFQAWYRDPTGSVCGSGFNLSNGVEVVFAP